MDRGGCIRCPPGVVVECSRWPGGRLDGGQASKRLPLAPFELHPPLSNKKASNKKLDSQISNFNRISKDLITKSNKNLLLKIKKSRLSLEKSSFLLDRRECNSL